MKCQAVAIQWGGGGSSRNFPWSPKLTIFSGGGGGSGTHFPLSPQCRITFSGRGGSGMDFRLNGALLHFFYFPKGGGPGAPRSPLNRPLISESRSVTELMLIIILIISSLYSSLEC